MNRLHLLVTIIVIAFHSISIAAPGDVHRRIDIPLQHPTGVAWTGQFIWVADRKADLFFKLNPENGAVIKTMESPGYFPSGLSWDGELLWSTDPAEGKIFATDLTSGLTTRTLDSPTPSPTGIAWDGEYLWICDNREDKILKIDPSDGTTINSFRSPARDPRGITFGDGYIWCSDRIMDKIFMIHPQSGHVVVTLDAPGPYSWGLDWKNGRLFNADYQDDSLFEIIVKDEDLFKISDPRRAIVNFTTEAEVLGRGEARSLEIYYAVPSDRPNQRLLSGLEFHPDPDRFVNDRWGQNVAVFHFENLMPSESIEVRMEAELETSAIRYFVFPEDVGSKIPSDIAKKYLADDTKYDIDHPYIKKIVKEIVGEEKNIYWKARKLFQYLIANMEYEMVGGWNTAPTVLKRKNGSCSEYSFSYIALCRSAGVPARYVGSLVVRGDDASYDDVFHRWCEIYLPGYGWIPVDANAGDREWPGEQAAAFGGISNRFLVTTEGGGDSEYLGWSYNHYNKWVTEGKCRIRTESTAEWTPLKEK